MFIRLSPDSVRPYWMIRTLFIAITPSWLEEHATASKFPVIQCFCDFFEFLSTEFAACKPPSRDNHRKASHPRCNNVTRVLAEHMIMRSGSSIMRSGLCPLSQGVFYLIYIKLYCKMRIFIVIKYYNAIQSSRY